MKIFIDLDGTLIDSKLRLYELFQHLVQRSNLTFDGYWELKKNEICHQEILENHFNYSKGKIKNFQKNWLQKIEEPEWLSLDTLFDEVVPFLDNLKETNDLYIVTARQFKENVITQLNTLECSEFFIDVFVTRQKETKTNLIKKAILVNEEDWFIGDTGKDIETGKELGINTAAVLSGFRNREVLSSYEPDILINSIIEFTP